MLQPWLLMSRVSLVAATSMAALAVSSAPASANPGVLVYPGMEIRQDTNVCTLSYVDPFTRVAYTAGHCRGSGAVGDRDGNFIGQQMSFQDRLQRLSLRELGRHQTLAHPEHVSESKCECHPLRSP